MMMIWKLLTIEYKIIEKTKIENEMKGDGTNRKEFTKKLELTEADRIMKTGMYIRFLLDCQLWMNKSISRLGIK
jgi:hypothetical protein